MNANPDPELNLGAEACVALNQLMDDYAVELVQRTLARREGHPEPLDADALRAAARWELDLVTKLRLTSAAGLALVAISGVAVTAALLPRAIHDTSARIFLAIGLLAATIAALAGIALYVAQHIGEPAMTRLLRRLRRQNRVSAGSDIGPKAKAKAPT